MAIFCIEFHDDEPDSLGRRRFSLTWKATGPVYSTEPGRRHIQVADGPVIRGQEFRANPERYCRQQPSGIPGQLEPRPGLTDRGGR